MTVSSKLCEAAIANERDSDETFGEMTPLGFRFAVLLAVLLSLPFWGGIIWLARLIWRSLTSIGIDAP